MTRSRVWTFALVASLMLACAHAPVNAPLAQADNRSGYRFENLPPTPGNGDETFVIVSVSGGGLRSSALFYGVMEKLQEMTRGMFAGGSLVDEIDVISAVSAGSVGAAYLALFGREAFFQRFPESVLHRNLQARLSLMVANPLNWYRLASPYFSRTDLTREYLDELLFHGATYERLLRKRPFLLLNATDLAQGAELTFYQGHFDRICSDLSQLSVSFAVTSSLALPIVFPPTELTNYAGTCGYRRPVWVTFSLGDDPAVNPRLHLDAKIWSQYEDAERRPTIELSDGVIADSLALAPVERSLTSLRGPVGFLRLLNMGSVKRLVLIAVDATPSSRLDPEVETAWFLKSYQASAAASEARALDTFQLLRAQIDRWQKGEDEVAMLRRRTLAVCNDVAREACKEAGDSAPECQIRVAHRCRKQFETLGVELPPQMDVYSILIRAEGLTDRALQSRFDSITTSLRLSEEDAATAIEVGHRLVERSSEFQRLLDDLDESKRDNRPPVSRGPSPAW